VTRVPLKFGTKAANLKLNLKKIFNFDPTFSYVRKSNTLLNPTANFWSYVLLLYELFYLCMSIPQQISALIINMNLAKSYSKCLLSLLLWTWLNPTANVCSHYYYTFLNPTVNVCSNHYYEQILIKFSANRLRTKWMGKQSLSITATERIKKAWVELQAMKRSIATVWPLISSHYLFGST
jgi:hypothetical protein